MIRKRWFPAVCVCSAALVFSAFVLPFSALAAESADYLAFKNAWENQQMPAYELTPRVDVPFFYVDKKYESVSVKNLQGIWENTYKDGKSSAREVLTVNGELARIETWLDGVKTGVWNDDGILSLEDRTYRKVCPAFRINKEDGDNVATIYIRKVDDDGFYDGGFGTTWKHLRPQEAPWLSETVTLEALQGVWYTEEGAGLNKEMNILTVEGDRASLLERLPSGELSTIWNGAGTASIIADPDNYPFEYMPELIIRFTEGSDGSAGIFISHVEENRFYDSGINRYWVRIPEDYDHTRDAGTAGQSTAP